MVKHLGPNGILFLTKLINLVVNTAIVPTNWKTGRIITLLKPNKPADQSSSYRQITLLPPSAKIMESAVLPDLVEAAPLKTHQHGFRKLHSTTTALTEITNYITDGLNKKKPVQRTVGTGLDLKSAFDLVNHQILLQDIFNMNMNHRLKKFLKSYLNGRQSYTFFQGVRSKFRILRQGVPQGGVLSPFLFNLYMSDMPTPSGSMKIITYADDTTILNRNKNIDRACAQMNPYLDRLASWFSERKLLLSATKSTTTVFTTASNEAGRDLPVYIDGDKIPTSTEPKLLGVTLDPMLNFGKHVKSLRAKLSQRNNVLKALAGSTWGKSKEVLLTTYKAIGKSLVSYGTQVWSPLISPTNWDLIQAQ